MVCVSAGGSRCVCVSAGGSRCVCVLEVWSDGDLRGTHQGCVSACSVRKRLVGFFSIMFLMKSLAVEDSDNTLYIYTVHIHIESMCIYSPLYIIHHHLC